MQRYDIYLVEQNVLPSWQRKFRACHCTGATRMSHHFYNITGWGPIFGPGIHCNLARQPGRYGPAPFLHVSLQTLLMCILYLPKAMGKIRKNNCRPGPARGSISSGGLHNSRYYPHFHNNINRIDSGNVCQKLLKSTYKVLYTVLCCVQYF